MAVDFELPSRIEKYDPDRGVKTVVEFYHDANGDLIKETKEYRKEKRIVSSSIAKRKEWKKFGCAEGDPPGGNSANTSLTESSDQEQEKKDEEDLKSKGRASAFVCRHCKGAHFTHQCPNRTELEKMQALQDRIRAKSETAENSMKETSTTDRPSHYIPPALRESANSGNHLGISSTPDKRPFDNNTIRVTNLPPDTTVDELKSIFSRFGYVTRIYPAKDKLTKQNRGFAFISYETAEQAREAIYSVDCLRHNHVILKVDWAKPSAN